MRWIRRILVGALLALAFGYVLVTYITPLPSVWVIRWIFDQGAATASDALDKHLPEGITTTAAVQYDPSDPDAFLDVHLPPNLDPAAPTVVWIHGGGFVSGYRSDVENYAKVLSGKGFAVVNVDYTTAPEAIFPTPSRQLSNALAYLQTHGAELGINPASMVLAGDSAGAQIAAQTAAVITSPAYSAAIGIPPAMPPDRLAGVLLYCGVFDLTAIGNGSSAILSWFLQSVTWAYSGKRDWRQNPDFALLSVASHATADFPPAFISAGNADPLEPQSKALAETLSGLGVSVSSVFFPETYNPPLGHEYQFDLDTEAGQSVLAASVDWLNWLKTTSP